METADFFSENGILCTSLQNCEIRPQQQEMAGGVDAALNGCSTAVIEAGTGVGKSLAYLIPAVLWAIRDDSRVIISTYSKALQHQLMEKELPFLRDALSLPFDFAMAMGTGNYLCRRRLELFLQHDRFTDKKEARQISKVAKWASKTSTGLRTELDFEVLPQVWDRVCRESDLCFRGKCIFSQECIFMRERARLRKSHIIVVNHHLFFAHLSAGESILPPFQAVVFDEAHCLEEVALHHFGISITPGQVRFLADNVFNDSTGRGFLPRLSPVYDFDFDGLKLTVANLKEQTELFFAEVSMMFDAFLPFRIKEPHWIVNTLSPVLRKFAKELKLLKEIIDTDLEEAEIDAYIRRAKEFAQVLDRLIKLDEPDFVYWVEAERGRRVSLNGASVNVGDTLAKVIFHGGMPVILASATLATDRKFDFIKTSLGIEDSADLLLDSPFDYKKNALIYMASDLPEPANRDTAFESASADRILELARIARGGCMALFTSYRHLNFAYEQMIELAPDLEIMKQGDMPHNKLIEVFRQTENALLLATNSFWQGVDIPGEALRMVVLVKLPFSVPDEPLTEARAEFCKSKGGNPFTDIHLPQAIIWLKQGFGRLIRSASDRGVVAILDKRIMTKFYGKKFITSLPKTLYTTRLADVDKFLNNFEEN